MSHPIDSTDKTRFGVARSTVAGTVNQRQDGSSSLQEGALQQTGKCSCTSTPGMTIGSVSILHICTELRSGNFESLHHFYVNGTPKCISLHNGMQTFGRTDQEQQSYPSYKSDEQRALR